MRKNLIIAFLAVVVLALAGVNVNQSRKLQQARENEARLPAAIPGAAAEASAVNTMALPSDARVRQESEAEGKRIQAESRIHQLESQLASLEAAQQAPADGAPAAASTKPAMADFAEMLKSPGMKDMIRSQQKGAMEITHGALLNYLQLPPGRLEAFKELLIDKQMALMDLGLDLMKDTASTDDNMHTAETAKRLTEDYDEKIRAFLGEDDYRVYEEYEKTQPERMQVHLFKQSLGSDEQLGEQQEHDLILAMHQERTAFTFSTDLDNQETFDPSQFSEEAVATHMSELAQMQEQYIARARGILSENQMNQFMNSLQQQRAMQEMGMRMAAQMFTKPSE